MMPLFQDSVGPNGVAGFDAVQKLSSYLVSLASESSLTNQQADEIIRLWNDLSPYDRQRVNYPARHQERILTGRFARCKTAVTPGVDSVKRFDLLSNFHLPVCKFARQFTIPTFNCYSNLL